MRGLNDHDPQSENRRAADITMSLDGHGIGRIAFWCTVGGCLIAIIMLVASGRIFLNERSGHATALGALGFSVAFIAPFVASLASFLTRATDFRRAIWLASGILVLVLAGLTIASGVGLLLGAAGAGLISAWWLSKGRTGPFGAKWSITLTAWLLFWLGSALAGLWLRESPVCWNDNVSGVGWVRASTPNECTSDIVDNVEGLLGLGGVAIGLVGMALILRGGNGMVARGTNPASQVRPLGL